MTGTQRRHARGIGIFLLALLCWLALCAGGALAHASLIDSDPAEGAVIDAPPATISLIFNEPVSPTRLALLSPDGETVTLDDVTANGAALAITPPADLGRGTHALSWRVISADGHPVGGTLLFSVGEVTAGAEALGEGARDWPLDILIWAAKVLIYTGFFVGVGGAFFSRWVGGRAGAVDHAIRLAAGAGLVAALVSIGLQGLDALGLTLAHLVEFGAWREGAATTWGRTVLLASLAFVAALIATGAGRRIGRALSALGLVLVGLALTASGHVSTAPPHWLTRPAIFIHGVTIAFWIGALIPLAVGWRTRAPDATITLHRFSRIIPWTVLLLIAAGVTMAKIQVGGPAGLITTTYGRVFMVKLLLLVVLFLVAAWNRWRLTRPVLKGDARAIRRFSRSIGVELALVLAIFAVVALWRFTPPPRALAAAEAAAAMSADPEMVHVEHDGNMIMLEIAPARIGRTMAEISLLTLEGEPVVAREVTLVLANPDAGIEGIRRDAHAVDDYGTWDVDDLILPAGGTWQFTIEALISDFDLMRVSGSIDIRG